MARKSSALSVTDLFCGAGGSSLGMHHASDDVEITLALNHWRLAVESHNANFPDTAHDCVDVSSTDPRRYRSTAVLWASPSCFIAGSLVLTQKGLVPIESVVVGDHVLTHTNRWREVTQTMTKTAKTIIVKGQGNSVGIEVTPEHPFYARKQRQEWNNAKRDYDRRILDGPTWLAAGQLVAQGSNERYRWATPARAEPLPIPQIEDRPMDFNNPAFWWIVGRWLGDGSSRERVSKRSVLKRPQANNRPYPAPCIVCGDVAEANRRYPHIANFYCRRCKALSGTGSEIQICCAKEEADELEERLRSSLAPSRDRAGAGELRWRRREGKTTTVFFCANNSLMAWLKTHFGKYAHGKTVPAWALTMPEENRQALLDGYISADGHISHRRTYATTVSKCLAIGIRLLATALGHHVSLSISSNQRPGHTIDGRVIKNVKSAYILGWENNHSSRTGLVDSEHAWTLLKGIEPGRDSVTVYNLSVEEDESYVVDGIVVHNCTNHSLAKGQKRRHDAQLELFGKPIIDDAAERSRATMFDVPRFAEYHDYEVVIVENVVDVRHWRMYDAWLQAMHALGYDHREVYFNSMFAHLDPAAVRDDHDFVPQSRDRIYIVFWKRGNRAPDLEFRPRAWCVGCATDVAAVQSWKKPGRKWGRYKQQYVYRCPRCAGEVTPYHFAAWNAIDWSLPAERIGDRKRPLEPRTLARIRKGLAKYGNTWLVVDTAYADGERTRPMLAVLPTQTARQTFGMATPQLVSTNYYDDRTIPVTEAAGTQTTANKYGLLMPQIVTLRNHGAAEAVTDEPLPTFAASGNHVGLLMPMPLYFGYASGDGPAHDVTEALPTMRSGNNAGVLVPAPFLTSYYGQGGDSDVTGEPVPTITATDRHAVVMPMPFLAVNYSPGYARSAVEPSGAITASDHHALVMPMPFYLGYANGSAPAHGVDESLPTLPGGRTPALAFPATPPAVEECGFRMLQPHEVGRGMAFPVSYRVLGNKRDQVRQFGNAVTPPVAKMIMRRVLATLT